MTRTMWIALALATSRTPSPVASRPRCYKPPAARIRPSISLIATQYCTYVSGKAHKKFRSRSSATRLLRQLTYQPGSVRWVVRSFAPPSYTRRYPPETKTRHRECCYCYCLAAMYLCNRVACHYEEKQHGTSAMRLRGKAPQPGDMRSKLKTEETSLAASAVAAAAAAAAVVAVRRCR